METHELIQDRDTTCSYCRGSGDERTDGGYRIGICGWCGGSGYELTNLGQAIWDLAKNAERWSRKND